MTYEPLGKMQVAGTREELQGGLWEGFGQFLWKFWYKFWIILMEKNYTQVTQALVRHSTQERNWSVGPVVLLVILVVVLIVL